MSWFEHTRPRQIVNLAASRVKNPSTKSWLKEDAEGTWERAAAKYLEGAPAIIEAKHLEMTDEMIDDEIASILTISALEATLAHATKRKKR